MAGADERPTREGVALGRQAAAVLAILGVLAVVLAVTTPAAPSFAPSVVETSDRLDRIVLRQMGAAQLSFDIAMVLREDAPRLADLRIPDRRDVISPLPWRRDILSKQVLRQLLRGRVTVADYDPRVSDGRLQRLLAGRPVRRMGKFPLIVVGPESDRYVVRTDAESEYCYVVPADLDRELGKWTGPPLPPGEPQAPDWAEVP